MADKKISELEAASDISGTELVPIVQEGVTKKAEASLFRTPPYDDTEIKKEIAEKQDKLIAGPNITIGEDGRTISATGGGSSGSTVSVTQTLKSGTEIAAITVDDKKTSIYTPSLTNYLDKTYTGENKIAGKLTVGTCSTNVNNAYLHQRNVSSYSGVVAGTNYVGASFAVNSDGSAGFFHKTYSDVNGGGARNSAVLRFYGIRGKEGGKLEFGTNATGNVAESDYKTVAMVDDIPTVSDTYSATSSNAMSGKAVAEALKTVPELIQKLHKED